MMGLEKDLDSFEVKEDDEYNDVVLVKIPRIFATQDDFFQYKAATDDRAYTNIKDATKRIWFGTHAGVVHRLLRGWPSCILDLSSGLVDHRYRHCGCKKHTPSAICQMINWLKTKIVMCC